MKILALPVLTMLAGGAAALTAFTAPNPTPIAGASYRLTTAGAAVDHSGYDRLLKKYVTNQGLVNYKGFKADEKEFDRYLALLSRNPPAASWSQGEQMAYWINAYNAYTIRLILDNYPLKSIKDIGEPWKKVFIPIGGQRMSLDDIEHGILRKQYNDPRIHFALVCAALTCPRLRNEAYTAARLNAQLDDQGRDFLNNPAKNSISPDKARLSKYFDWYKSDWTENGQSVAKWVNRYSKTKIKEQTPVTFLDYNWKLNEQ